STTMTSLAYCRALRTTEPIVAPSLKAGMATKIFDSGEVRRKTAGTGEETFLSMALSTLHSEVEQGNLASSEPPRRNPRYNGFARIFRAGIMAARLNC